MKNKIKLFGIIAMVVIIGFLMIACEEDCYGCYGDGLCHFCGGDGLFSVSSGSENNAGCPQCGGSGNDVDAPPKVAGNGKCNKCGGSGK